MTTAQPPERFTRFIELLTATAVSRPDIVGLVGMGSTAQRDRVDEWSDHDFALVTEPGAEERYRSELSWLPGDASIALSVVEHHGGVKVIYDDGHVLEFGITSLHGLAEWAGNTSDVFYDTGGVADAFAAMVARPFPAGAPDDARDIRLVLTQVLIGVGRYRRGEVLSAGESVRAEALAPLLRVLGRRLDGDRWMLDSLDPRRRFEFVHPALAARIAASLEGDVESAGRELLAIAETELEPHWDQFPRRGLAAVRQRLGWE